MAEFRTGCQIGGASCASRADQRSATVGAVATCRRISARRTGPGVSFGRRHALKLVSREWQCTAHDGALQSMLHREKHLSILGERPEVVGDA